MLNSVIFLRLDCGSVIISVSSLSGSFSVLVPPNWGGNEDQLLV